MSIKHVLLPFSAWVRALTKPYTVPRAKTMRPGATAMPLVKRSLPDRNWLVVDVTGMPVAV